MFDPTKRLPGVSDDQTTRGAFVFARKRFQKVRNCLHGVRRVRTIFAAINDDSKWHSVKKWLIVPHPPDRSVTPIGR